MAPKRWAIKSLGSVLERVSDPVIPVPDVLYREIGIRSHGKGIFHKEPVFGKILGDKRVFKVHSDCFVVNIVFAWEQAVARTTAEETGMIASHRFPMYRPVDGLCDVDFLTYYFKTKKGKYLLELASPGGAGRNKTLGQTEFSRLAFSMPSGEEQAKIAKVLSTWDKAIAVTEKLIASNKAQKEALMQDLLTGRRRFAGFRGKWRAVPLKKVADVVVSNVDKKFVEAECPVRLCNYTDVYHNNYITHDMDFMLATATQREIDKFSLQKGDVVVTKDSETPDDIAVPALVRDELSGVLCGYHLAIVRPTPGVADGEFLASLFSLPKMRRYFFSLANGATRFGLSVEAIAGAEIRIPEVIEQRKIASVIMKLNDATINLSAQLERLKKQKAALMQQLLTGRRRVKVNPAA